MGRTVISKKDSHKSSDIVRKKLQDFIGKEREYDIKGPIMWEGEVVVRAQDKFLKDVEVDIPDKYTDRLLKYIPAEVVALYLTLDAILRSTTIEPIVKWIVFFVCLFGTFLYLWRVEKVDKKVQLFISVVAYVVWVFAIGGPFVELSWYKPIYGGLLLPIYTFFIPIVEA